MNALGQTEPIRTPSEFCCPPMVPLTSSHIIAIEFCNTADQGKLLPRTVSTLSDCCPKCPLQSEGPEFAVIIIWLVQRWIAESAVLVRISGTHKLEFCPKTVYEKIRFLQDAEIREGIEQDFLGVRGDSAFANSALFGQERRLVFDGKETIGLGGAGFHPAAAFEEAFHAGPAE